MDAGRGREPCRVPGQRERALAAGDRLPDHDHVAHAGLTGAGQNVAAVGVERPVRQMAVGVDQHGQTAALERPPPLGVGAAGGTDGAVVTGARPEKARAPRASCPGQRFSMYMSTGAAM